MRTTLELYVMALVRAGIRTPYELKVRADLSLGSTIPALGRLEKEGLIKASELGARRSRRYSVTSKGEKILRTAWREQLDAQPTDLDSILRITYLIWIHKSPNEAAGYLRQSGLRLASLAKVADAEAIRFGKNIRIVDNEAMRWLRARVQARGWTAEADELLRISKDLSRHSQETTDRPKQKTTKR
jgi:DNA-binding PadR family transcriptional regulator